ncbi:hypothetical protein F5X68DRAFT_196264 [Plectosphaerella plurivora]|uniref:Uncharacterized protein n=1 Tax=Plectosphaerella plurivora TaxID=936078 RepID=A0A9P8VNM1_9PEZI|nr:hypothetical protein F5X68DRAFT_196264 [Plectosphaerella plurivora]
MRTIPRAFSLLAALSRVIAGVVVRRYLAMVPGVVAGVMEIAYASIVLTMAKIKRAGRVPMDLAMAADKRTGCTSAVAWCGNLREE